MHLTDYERTLGEEHICRLGIRREPDGWSVTVSHGDTTHRRLVMRTRAAARRADISDYPSDPDFIRHA